MSKTAKKKKNQYRIRDGVLFYKGRIVAHPIHPSNLFSSMSSIIPSWGAIQSS